MTPDNLVLQVVEKASMLHLGVVELALGAQDDTRGHAPRLQGLHDLLGIPLPGPLPYQAVQVVLVGLPGLQGAKARVAGPVGSVHDRAKAGPLLVGEDGDGAPGVVTETGIGVVGGGPRVPVAVPDRLMAVEGVVHLDGRYHLQAALQLRQVQVLAHSRLAPVV